MSTLVTTPHPALPVVPTLRWANVDEGAWMRTFAAALRARGVHAVVRCGVVTVTFGKAVPFPRVSARLAARIREEVE